MTQTNVRTEMRKDVESSDSSKPERIFFVPAGSEAAASDEMTSAFGILTAPLKHRRQKNLLFKNRIEVKNFKTYE